MTGRFLPGVPGPQIEAILDAAAGNEIATGSSIARNPLRPSPPTPSVSFSSGRQICRRCRAVEARPGQPFR